MRKKALKSQDVLKNTPKAKNKESGQDRAPNHKPFSNISAEVEGRILLEKVKGGKIIAYNDQ